MNCYCSNILMGKLKLVHTNLSGFSKGPAEALSEFLVDARLSHCIYEVYLYTTMHCMVPDASLSIELGVRRCSVEWNDNKKNKEVIFLFFKA